MDIPLFSEYGVNYLVRWGHLLFGIVWIGLLYYFNFVQTEYFKEADADHRSGAIQKLVPRALWWFRWGAMGTFLTGAIMLFTVPSAVSNYIWIGSLFGTLMFLNVWLIIWPNQKIALGMVEGDGPAAGAKALLASRHNVLFSAPMAFCMLASGHGGMGGWAAVDWSATSMIVIFVLSSPHGTARIWRSFGREFAICTCGSPTTSAMRRTACRPSYHR